MPFFCPQLIYDLLITSQVFIFSSSTIQIFTQDSIFFITIILFGFIIMASLVQIATVFALRMLRNFNIEFNKLQLSYIVHLSPSSKEFPSMRNQL